jgi:hypothetical protein
MQWRRANQRAAAVQILNAHATPCTTAGTRETSLGCALAGLDLSCFRLLALGNAASMIGLGIAFLVIGIIFLFFLPWVGIPIGIVGLVLVIIWLGGLARTRAVP